MIYYEQQYYEALSKVLKDNEYVIGRGDVPVIKCRGPIHFEINLLREGLPVLRGKKMFLEKPLVELIWMLSGRNDLDFLHTYNVHYWDIFDIGDGTIGNSYGPRIRNFHGFDQLEYVVKSLQTDPTSRRIAISFWDPQNDKDSVVPCYSFIQFKVIDKYVNMYVTQRSGDAFIGVPNDVLLFAYLLSIISYVSGWYVGTLYYTVNDFHIYTAHLPAVNTYFKQYEGWHALYSKIMPVLHYNFRKYIETQTFNTIDDLLKAFTETEFKISYNYGAYKSNPYIKAEVIK